MRVTVLGGSAACPNPGDASASYLVQHGDASLVLDCGPGSVPVLRRYVRLRGVSGVVISHLHSDHTIDLVPFRYGLRYIPNGGGPRVPLWLPPGGVDFLDRLSGVFALGPEAGDPFFATEFDVAEYDPRGQVSIGPFSISFLPTRHFIDCWAMRIEAGARTLVYLADTCYFESLAEFARDADLLVCEATVPPLSPATPPSEGHLTAVEAGRIAAGAQARHLLLTHMWAENDVGAEARDARSAYDGAITIAASGVQVEV